MVAVKVRDGDGVRRAYDDDSLLCGMHYLTITTSIAFIHLMPGSPLVRTYYPFCLTCPSPFVTSFIHTVLLFY